MYDRILTPAFSSTRTVRGQSRDAPGRWERVTTAAFTSRPRLTTTDGWQRVETSFLDRPPSRDDVLRGVTVACAGEFASRRGAFDSTALVVLHALLTHWGFADVHLGHGKQAPRCGYLQDFAVRRGYVTADLHFTDRTIGKRIVQQARERPASLAMSISGKFRTSRHGVWVPESVRSIDLVASGDATAAGLYATPTANLELWLSQRR